MVIILYKNMKLNEDDNMYDRRGEKYKNNISYFKIGDIVRFKDVSFDKCYGEMKVVDFFVEVKHKRHEKRVKSTIMCFLILVVYISFGLGLL